MKARENLGDPFSYLGLSEGVQGTAVAGFPRSARAHISVHIYIRPTNSLSRYIRVLIFKIL